MYKVIGIVLVMLVTLPFLEYEEENFSRIRDLKNLETSIAMSKMFSNDTSAPTQEDYVNIFVVRTQEDCNM